MKKTLLLLAAALVVFAAGNISFAVAADDATENVEVEKSAVTPGDVTAGGEEAGDVTAGDEEAGKGAAVEETEQPTDEGDAVEVTDEAPSDDAAPAEETPSEDEASESN